MVKKTKFDWNKLASSTGEESIRRVRYEVPILKFNGNTGKFSILNKQPDGTLLANDLGSMLKGVILKIRRTYTSFEKLPEGNVRYFTNEHDSFKDELILFERKSNTNKTNMVMQGSLNEIRAANSNLRLKQLWYFLINLDGEETIVKLGVKGKSLSSAFEFFKEFKSDEHFCQFNIEISSHQEQNEGGLNYYVMDFKKLEESDYPTVEKKIEEVVSALELQDKSFQERSASTQPMVEETSEELPSIAENPSDGTETDIKIEDIPY